jgi:hypothetical protein
MKLRKENYTGKYDLAIVGLGYENRAITACKNIDLPHREIIAIGYDTHTNVCSYQKNKKYYEKIGAKIIEGPDITVTNQFIELIKEKKIKKPINCFLDITVMSRYRLAFILSFLIDHLEKTSTITIGYEISDFYDAPKGLSPIRKIGPILNSLSGSLSDINLPSAIVLGLGYELGKGIGISNYLDTESTFLFIPQGKDSRFEESVMQNNQSLISETPSNHKFFYDITNPYKTYLELRETMSAILQCYRPVLVPLGPKIMAALSVILGKEFSPQLPVWRVSSEHIEEPINRESSGDSILLTLDL